MEQKNAKYVLDADLITLRSVVSVVDEGSFSDAAKRVGRSQSAVSLQIAKLEERMHIRLFERTSRSVTLTPAGEVFTAYARRILALADEAYAAVSSPVIKNPLRIGFAEYLVPHHLYKLLTRFKRLHPNASVELTLGVGNSLVRDLREGLLDIVVAGPEGEKGVLLMEEALVWVGPHDEHIELGEGRLELILMQPPCSYRKVAFEALAGYERPWNLSLSANSIQGTQSAVAAGLGVSVIPKSAVSKDLKILTHGLPALPRTSIQAFSNAADSHPLIEPFIAFLKEELAEVGVG
ncbi:DNA-binding transcriptional regulator, LysR family [Desulfomicrobium norvegicum]|jgi:DNA-binding transcriptional LysR family regulator|uniref:DNA-binding transcriptional regulator, LysR family n=1 Tax=Desulfomicrobium norvegicum (strain DSM 1741 / NCIMB 8310) TaxID=52561 RepID=A0A8G2F609_DESNO|nr:LysR family transcriptional regulator [Desulfomicrobium norvegicum]SFM16982.1 DNA-binding transcriptional regulator, LysR family [Desulfomicrobium norvegicum]